MSQLHSSTAIERLSVSVPTLYVRPQTATVACDRVGRRDRDLRLAQSLCWALLVRTDARSGVIRFFSAPTALRNAMSRDKVPPANAPPGDRYALGPIRLSPFSPRSTSLASAPTSSQIEAISFANVTDVARNALMACLVISADSTDIHSIRSVI